MSAQSRWAAFTPDEVSTILHLTSHLSDLSSRLADGLVAEHADALADEVREYVWSMPEREVPLLPRRGPNA